MIEQAISVYSPLGKAFEKQTKTIEEQGEKQMKAIEDNKKQLNKKNNYVIMNYCFQKKEKYLRIFTTKDLIK